MDRATITAVTHAGVAYANPLSPATRERLDVVREFPLADVDLAPASLDLVACVASSHAFGRWAERLSGMAALTRPGGRGLAAEGFSRRPPSAAHLELLGGATADELPDLDGLPAGARAADGRDTLGFAVLRLRARR